MKIKVIFFACLFILPLYSMQPPQQPTQDDIDQAKETILATACKLCLIQKEYTQDVEEFKKIIAKYGWPKYSQFGKDTLNNALIITGLISDLSFQQQCLRLIDENILEGDNIDWSLYDELDQIIKQKQQFNYHESRELESDWDIATQEILAITQPSRSPPYYDPFYRTYIKLLN